MYTALDDTLRHQLPMTFDRVGSSDHRFYDRYWMSFFALNREIWVTTGMGLYSNMNVMDGFGCAIYEGKSHNVRVSRHLRPNFDTSVGPLRYEIVEPVKKRRLILEENDYNLSFDVEWEAVAPPHEEDHHFDRFNGWAVCDYIRFDQMGRVSGWVKLGDKTFQATKETWAGCFDHSWGTRFEMGSPDPAPTMQWAMSFGRRLGMMNWLLFHVGDYSCHFSFFESPDGRRNSFFEELPTKQSMFDGSIEFVYGDERAERKLVQLEHDLEFFPGTRRLKRGKYIFLDEAGEEREVVVERIPGYISDLRACGYMGGYKDGLGLGAPRSELLVEGDVWDVSDPMKVIDAEGNERPTPYREGGIIVYQGDKVGGGHIAEAITLFPRYGFTEPISLIGNPAD